MTTPHVTKMVRFFSFANNSQEMPLGEEQAIPKRTVEKILLSQTNSGIQRKSLLKRVQAIKTFQPIQNQKAPAAELL